MCSGWALSFSDQLLGSLIQWEDTLRSHPAYVHSAIEASRVCAFRSSVFLCSILKLGLDISQSVRRPEISLEAVIRVYVLSTPPIFVVFIWKPPCSGTLKR